MKEGKNITKTIFTEKHTDTPLCIDGYEIFFGPIESLELQLLSKKNKESYLSLLEMAQISPSKILDQTRELKKKAPSVGEIDNLLTYVLVQCRLVEEAEKNIIEAYKKYPDYFFAKINYADYLLRKKDHFTFTQLFQSDDLRDYFPGKTRFHVSEYRSFNLLLCSYYLAIKDKKTARLFYDKALLADPTHPSVIAKEKKFSSIFSLKKIWQLFDKLNALLKIKRSPCLDKEKSLE